MQKIERSRRQDALERCIYKLSESLLDTEADARKITLELLDIYNGNFRHSYSGFFTIILTISKEDNNYSLDYLSDNIETVRRYIEDDFESGIKEFQALYSVIDKLSDHISLEIGRLNYYSINDNKIRDMEKRITETTEALKTATANLNEASKKASTMQTELIAVLSIFSAIVITFSGGLTFLGSAMTSITNATRYEAVIIVAIICGVIIFNTIFLMMYLVSKLTERNIYVGCKSKECQECVEKKCNFSKRIRRKMPYVYYFNILAFMGMGVDLIVWFLDIRGIL